VRVFGIDDTSEQNITLQAAAVFTGNVRRDFCVRWVPSPVASTLVKNIRYRGACAWAQCSCRLLPTPGPVPGADDFADYSNVL
jgi:hypothetical protein